MEYSSKKARTAFRLLNIRNRLIVVLSIFFILFGYSKTVVSSDKLIPNSGFEKVDKNGYPMGWHISLGKNGKFKITNNSYEGKWSLLMENFELGDEVNIAQSVQVKPHTDYVFSFIAKGNSMQDLRHRLSVQAYNTGETLFSNEKVYKELMDSYKRVLNAVTIQVK